MNLWLDDDRCPPDPDWRWVKTVDSAIEKMATNKVEIASLDHDLGASEETGNDLLLWMAERDVWPQRELRLHSADAEAREIMRLVIDGEGPFTWEQSRSAFVRHERSLGPEDG